MYSQPNPQKRPILTCNLRENFARSFDFFQQFSCNLFLKGIFVHWCEKHGRQPVRFCPICVLEPISNTYVKWLNTYQLAFAYAMSKIKTIKIIFFLIYGLLKWSWQLSTVIHITLVEPWIIIFWFLTSVEGVKITCIFFAFLPLFSICQNVTA